MVDTRLIARDPAKVVEQVDPPPCCLSDREEDALIAAVWRSWRHAALLTVEADDVLLAETRATIERMVAALPDGLRRVFLDVEPVRLAGSCLRRHRYSRVAT